MPSLRRPVLIASLLAAALATGVGALVAEDIDPAAVLDSVKASYEAKKYGKALSDLQLVLAEIGRLRMEALKVKLPGAPSGWTAEEAEGQSGGGIAFLTMGTNVKRRYTKGEQSSMEIELWADAGTMLMGVQMLLSNPAFVPQGQQIVTIKGRRAVLEFHKDDGRGTLTILLNAAGSMVKIEGSTITKADLTDVFGGALDLDAIEKAIQE